MELGTQFAENRSFEERRVPGAAPETDMSAKRAVIRLQLDIAAKQALDRLCERRGMTQIAVLSRLVKWFATQDEVIQASVLGLMSDESLGELAEILLQRLSGKRNGEAEEASLAPNG